MIILIQLFNKKKLSDEIYNDEQAFETELRRTYTTRNVSGRNTYAPPGRNVSDIKWFWRDDIPVT